MADQDTTGAPPQTEPARVQSPALGYEPHAADKPAPAGVIHRDADRDRSWIEVSGIEVPETMNWSTLRGFEWCQAQWAFTRADPQPYEPSPAGMIGTAVHSILAGLQRSNDVHDLWMDAALDMPKVIPYKERVMEIVAGALAWDESRNAIARGIGAEKRVEGFVAGVPLRGRIDLLEDDDGLVVSDWKTNQPGNGDPDFYTSEITWRQGVDLRQTVVYSILVSSDDYGERPKKVRMYELGDERMTELDLRGQQGRHALVEAERFVEVNTTRITAAVADSAFEMNGTAGQCRTCPWRATCPGSKARPAGELMLYRAA